MDTLTLNPVDTLSPSFFKDALNQEQFDAVTTDNGPVLVLAGAGSGKTRTLTYRVAWLLSQGVQAHEILLLTFTNKAAKEMLERVEALTCVPRYRFWGGTFHHIGQKFLRKHGACIDLADNFVILDQSDSESLLTQAIKECESGFLKNKDNPKASVIYAILSYSRNVQKTLKETLQTKYPYFDHLESKLKTFFDNYTALKKKQQLVDYDDLLELWLKILRQEPEIAKHYQDRFKHILVDEYQDTNALQSAIIDTLGIHHQIMAVGDDAQCIYTWRGADIDNILTFPNRHPNCTIHKIETNYRSTPNILRLANGILEGRPTSSSYSKELKPTLESRTPPYFIPAADTKQQAQFVLKRIQGLVQEGYALSDIAILYRAHYHAMDMQMELSKNTIPYQITSGVRFFEQAHIKDAVSLLRFANNPLDSTAFQRFSTLLPKVGEKTAQKILLHCQQLTQLENISLWSALEHPKTLKKIPEPAKEAWIDIAYTLQDIAAALQKGESPQNCIEMVVDGWYEDYLKTLYTNWDARAEDLKSLAGFASRFEDTSELLAQLTLLSSESTARGYDPSEDSIKLTTIHQAKGLEFPVVFIIGLADQLFPTKRAIEEDGLDEELRLFYVASTRARHELYLVYPKMSFHGGPPTLYKPSRFVAHLDPSLYEVVYPSKMY